MAAPAVCVSHVVLLMSLNIRVCLYICVRCVPLNIVRSHTKPQ